MNSVIKQPLKDFGQIQFCQNYLKIEAEKNLKHKKKIVINKRFVEREEYCTINRDVDGGYVCFYENNDSERIYYYHFLLESLVGRIMLDPNATTNALKGQVTIKRLREFPVLIPSKDVLYAAVYLDFSIKTIINLAQKENDKLFFESAKNLMKELRDDFVMELYANDLFLSHHISIVEPLVAAVKDCKLVPRQKMVYHILQAITAPESTVLSNMRRFRVLLSNFNHNNSSI